MKVALVLAAFLVLCSFVESASRAEILEFIDKDGVIHFTNVPLKGKRRPPGARSIPSKSGAKARKGANSAPSSAPARQPNTQPGREEGSFCTGWPVSEGYVVTSYHVVKGRKAILLILADGSILPATLAKGDPASDIALLAVSNDNLGKLPPALPLAATAPESGAKVFTVGYPAIELMGQKPRAADGSVSGANGFCGDKRACQIRIPAIQEGNNGGPLIDANGEVVGVVTSRLHAAKAFAWKGDLPQDADYAVKAEYLKTLLGTPQPNTAKLKELTRGQKSQEELVKSIQGSVLLVKVP